MKRRDDWSIRILVPWLHVPLHCYRNRNLWGIGEAETVATCPFHGRRTIFNRFPATQSAPWFSLNFTRKRAFGNFEDTLKAAPPVPG